MTKRTTWGIISLFTVALIAVLYWYNRYDIYDWWVLRSYTPPAQVEALATNSGMDEYGRRLFYVKEPKLQDRDGFNESCNQFAETLVLGCYTGTDIYIFDVTNQELDGIKEVTAAHEMLHAAYDRLSNSERQRVDKLLLDMYSNMNDTRISELVKSYQSKNPSIVTNELHSILGTEVRKLSPQLEEYYSQYFDDRSKVVDLSNQYEEVFDEARNEAERISAELSLRKAEITRLEADLSTKEKELASLRAQLDSRKNGGNIEAYNTLVPVFNNQVNTYNQDVANVKNLISQYNDLVKEYNKVALYQQDLVQSIDSRSQYKTTE